MSWSNAALPSAADTKYDFPKGTVLSHSSKLDTVPIQRNWVKITLQDLGAYREYE